MSSLPILVLNSGSSSIKFSMYEAGDGERLKLYEGAVDGIGTDQGKFWIKDAEGNKPVDQSPALPNRSVAFKMVADLLNSGEFPAPAAIGHRMVCAAPTLQVNQRVTPGMIDEMERYKSFAPLHTPIGAYIMREALDLFAGIPNFACSDSYFHRTMPEVVTHMPIPAEYSAMGVRRIGFHGISYESIVYQLQPNIPEKLIVAHLGNGASISAIRNGECLDTSMGLTPTGGIISGTRVGDIDPGILLFILRKIAEKTENANDAANQLEAVANKKAGLLGMSELSNDMRVLRGAINAGNTKARMAVDKFNWTIVKWIGSFFAELGRTRHAGLYRRHRRKRHCRSRGDLRRSGRSGHRARSGAQQRPWRSHDLCRRLAGNRARDSTCGRLDHCEPCSKPDGSARAAISLGPSASGGMIRQMRESHSRFSRERYLTGTRAATLPRKRSMM
jgi:acetate kinase